MKYYVSHDSAAVSIGANETAAALAHAANGVELVRTGSRGLYWLEPLVEVEQNGRRLGFGPVEANAVDALVAAIADRRVENHPQYVGDIDGMLADQGQHRLTFARCGVIAPTDWDAFVAHGGSAGLRAALGCEGQQIVDTVKESGLRGRGGAGFPTGIKWQTGHDAPAMPKYIVCNADEGDSGTYADRMIMEGDPFTLLEGMAIAGVAVGAEYGYIYLRSEYPDAERTLKHALDVARDNGMLGDNVLGSGKAFDIQVRMGAGAYICGEETSLLESLEGKRGLVRFKPPLPAIQGFMGQPTVINNVITLSSVPSILVHGAARYRDLGVNKSRGTLTIQLCGNVARPGLYEMPFGVTLKRLINDIGGGCASGRPVRAVQVGGPLGAYVPAVHLDTELGYEEMAEIDAMINGSLCAHGGMPPFPVLSALNHFPEDFGVAETAATV